MTKRSFLIRKNDSRFCKKALQKATMVVLLSFILCLFLGFMGNNVQASYVGNYMNFNSMSYYPIDNMDGAQMTFWTAGSWSIKGDASVNENSDYFVGSYSFGIKFPYHAAPALDGYGVLAKTSVQLFYGDFGDTGTGSGIFGLLVSYLFEFVPYGRPEVFNIDFTINNISETHPAAVPVPPTVLLFGSGLIGFVGWRRKLRI